MGYRINEIVRDNIFLYKINNFRLESLLVYSTKSLIIYYIFGVLLF